MTPPAPANRRQLFDAIAALTRSGWHDITGYGGTGGPGVYLEHELGFDPGSADRPDALGWELKWYTDRTIRAEYPALALVPDDEATLLRHPAPPLQPS